MYNFQRYFAKATVVALSKVLKCKNRGANIYNSDRIKSIRLYLNDILLKFSNPKHRDQQLKKVPLSKVVLIHGSVQTLITIHTTLVQMFGELAGNTVECLREGMMAGSQTAVLVTAGPVHGVLLHLRISLHHVLQVPIDRVVFGVQVDVLHFGTCVDRVTRIVNCFVL